MSKTVSRYIVRHKESGKYISTFTLPPGEPKLCVERSDSYKFHDKKWIEEKISFCRDSNIYEIIEIKIEKVNQTEEYRHSDCYHELLKSLNESGLKIISHHISDECHYAFVSILLDNVDLEIKDINEVHMLGKKYNGKKELLIKWLKK
jgi:L-rhamnose mutarotase